MSSSKPSFNLDLAIVGGGIAGVWLLNLLSSRGYNAVLLETEALGCDQTLASQGMIHGGLKYALAGALNPASEAIAAMPQRWRACLDGNGEIDLSGLPLLSECYYMFAEGSALGKLTSFFAAKALRGRIEALKKPHWPGAFNGFDGVVYALNDFVVDTAELLERLAAPFADRVLKLACDAGTVSRTTDGFAIELDDALVHVDHLVSCAGNGSAALLKLLHVGIKMQQRPLKQVIVRPTHATELFAHCLTGVSNNEPRLTITTHTSADHTVWYLGGRLATTGVARSDAEQIEFARQELEACVPWLYWQDASFEALTVNRAEPYSKQRLRPDAAYAEREGCFVQCFPTKLTLAPDLGDKVLALLEPPKRDDAFTTQHARADLGKAPWTRC